MKSIKLNETEKQILQYLQDNIEDLGHIGIRKVADANWTSPSSVFRLAQKLGFSGYKEFSYYLTSHTLAKQDVTSETDILTLARDINLTLSCNQSALDKLIDTMGPQSSILMIANGYSDIIASYFAKKLTVYGYRVIQISSSGSYTIVENNLAHITHIIILTRSGETRSLIAILKKFPIQDKVIICFTQEVKSTIAKLADVTFAIVDENQGDWDNINYSQFHPMLLFFIEHLLSKLHHK